MTTNAELSTGAIRLQLKSILNNSELKNSVILSNFLEFVVTEKLAGRDGQIKEYTIGVQALGRSPDFNPQVDSNVRIHAGRLRRILRDYYSHEGREDEIVITMPKGTYVPNFELERNLKAALTGSHPDPGASGNVATLPPGNLFRKPVLAVLPFYTLTPENSKDLFADAIAERLNTDLAKFQHIRVISYFTTNKYDAGIDLEEMRKQLVDFVLTGSVRIVEESVRLSIQLLLTGNGEIIWSENYQRSITSAKILEIEEEIITKVLNTLADDNGVILRNKVKAAIHDGKPHSELERAVYQYYDFSNEFEPGKFESTLAALERTNRLYPEFPLTSALLSGLYLNVFAVTPEHDGKLLNEALQLAKAAISYDGYSQEGRKAMAWAYLYLGNKERSMEEIEKCIKINPKAATTLSTMALAYICLGEYQQGLKWLDETANLNDYLPVCSQLGYAIYYYRTAQYEQSLAMLQRQVPLQFPFFVILQHSIEGHLAIKSTAPGGNLKDIYGHSETIINRFIFDRSLQMKIREGLKLYQEMAVFQTPGSRSPINRSL